MQLNQQHPFTSTHLPTPFTTNKNKSQPDYENSTSTKTINLPSNPLKSPPTSPKSTSPLTQFMEIKNIKNDEFLFRMKLKFIACMQQLEIGKEDIEILRRQQSDTDILSSFITPIKREFSVLKKIKDQSLLQQTKYTSSGKSTKNIQSLEIISLESQIQQISDSEKKLKLRIQKLFTQNTQLLEKLKKKQNQYEQSQNNLYQTRLLLKEYESVIENLKSSAKKVEKDFVNEKQRLNEETNAFKEIMIRERQAKQIYCSKLETVEIALMEKEDIIKRLTEQVDFLKKQCIKWKNRSEWKENQSSQQSKSIEKKIQSLQSDVQKLNDQLKKKDSEIILAKKEVSGSTDVFNKKLEKIVEEWKAKLIDTIEEYESTIEKHYITISQLQKQNQRLKASVQQELTILSKTNQELRLQLSISKTQYIQSTSSVQRVSTQLKQQAQANHFYTQKIKQLESIITQLKSQNTSKSLTVEKSIGSLSELETKIKAKNDEIDGLKQKLLQKESESVRMLHAKKQTEDQLLKRISNADNNRIVEVSRAKVENDEKVRILQTEVLNSQAEIQKLKLKLPQAEQAIDYTPQKPIQPLSLPKQDLPTPNFAQTPSSMSSSYQSVNNSLTFSSTNRQSNPQSNDRSNRLISQTYMQPQKKSSIRRVFVRSNSINEYLKQSGLNALAGQKVINGIVSSTDDAQVMAKKDE